MRNYLIRFILLYLRFFAKKTLKNSKCIKIGIAGSVGKSSARNALYAILKEQSKTVALEGNSETGIPLSILGLSISDYSYISWIKLLLKTPFQTNNLRGVTYLIAEMGIDEPNPPKNMSYLLTILKPDIALSLNVSATHTQQFEKIFKDKKKINKEKLLDAIAREDTKIITDSNCRVGIYNADNPFIVKFIEKFQKNNSSTEIKSFGTGKENNIRLLSYSVGLKKTTFTFILNEKKKRELSLSFKSFILPKAYADTFMAVVLAARTLKIPLKKIQENIEANFSLPNGRASALAGIKNSLIIDSTYNASKESVLPFLELLGRLKKETKRQVVFVFGDMRELGDISQSEHEEVARKALEVANYIYCVGPQTKEYVMPILEEGKGRRTVDHFKNAIQLGLHLKENLPNDTIVLLKGSQNEIFLEEAVKFLLKNPADEKKLCRQSEFWKNKKANFFNLNSN